MMQMYRGSLCLALQDLFPNVALDPRKFARSSSMHSYAFFLLKMKQKIIFLILINP